MRHFSTLKEAFNFYHQCPVCHGSFRMMGLESVITSPHDPIQRTLRLRSGEITVELDLETERLLTVKEERSLDWMYSMDGAKLEFVGGRRGYQFARDIDGSLTLNERLGCHNCGKFGANLTISIAAKTERVSGVITNSEHLNFDINDQAYLINNYGTETCISSGTDIVCPPLPLIPFNLDNIQETIDRIKKLLVFS